LLSCTTKRPLPPSFSSSPKPHWCSAASRFSCPIFRKTCTTSWSWCKNGRHIEEKFAHTYFDAIGLGIDFTARDLQSELKKKGLPWELAKAFDGSAPISPTFRPVADFADLANINFKLEVNGEVRQQGNSGLMLHPFAKIIAFVSQYITLKQGDLIFTGTPAGVGQVQPGDELVGYLEGEKILEVPVR
jgi:2-keto-4-pentenoate hydratase/2-oxohepta-3-ene-1,7-dioic acid hydratase in catechol pathway